MWNVDVDCATGSFSSSCAIPPSIRADTDFGAVKWFVMCAATTAAVRVIES